VAYHDKADLWLYDGTADTSRRITADADARYEHEPEFLTGRCLLYASSEPTTIELLDLSTGESRTIVEERGWITSLDASPDGTSILYLQIDHNVDGTYRLKRVGIDGGTPKTLHTFDPNLGRGVGSEDEVSVAWSPDGSAILVANTHAYSEAYPRGALYLFDETGSDLRERWTGTHPRWSPDGRTIYFRGYAGENGQRWSALDVRTMQATDLGLLPGTNRLVVSPDGRRLAYDTSVFGDRPSEARFTGEAPAVYVYDLATGAETVLRRGALEPLWIADRTLLVTNAREQGRHSLNSWESLGTVTRISMGGDRSPADMTSTLFEWAVYIGS
jgi:Tol biopolymer transport system component